MTERRRALVIGIDGYPDAPAVGCCNDAKAMATLLATNEDGTRNWAVERCLGRDARVPVLPTVELAGRLARHFADAEDADLLFYFSGHARRSTLGVELCSQDGTSAASGVSFDSLMTLIAGAVDQGARTVTVLLDCCFAGDLGAGADDEHFAGGHLPENVVILAAARPGEVTSQGLDHSPFTEVLLTGLEGAASDLEGNVNALALFYNAQRAAPARGPQPQLRANCDQLPTLRSTSPALDEATGRELRRHFAHPNRSVPPPEPGSWDGGPLQGPDAHPVALVFWRLRRAGLLESEPAGATLAWLSANGGTLKLSHRGRYYWNVLI